MVRFGRNREFAWGITNNICMQRDLYVERLNPELQGIGRYEFGWSDSDVAGAAATNPNETDE